MNNNEYQRAYYASDFPNNTFPNFSDENGFGIEIRRDKALQTFSLIVPEGSYQIEIEIEGVKDNSRFTIWSEDRRLMALPQIINGRQKLRFSFYANMRNPNIINAEQDSSNAPKVGLRGEELVSRNWDNCLSINIAGEGVKFAAIRIVKTGIPKILLAGDSTVTDQPGGDYASWGQILPAFIKNYPIANHARSGETLKSFIFSLRWDKLLSLTKPGDIVLIQFGHNDQKGQWPRTYSAFDGAYPEYLRAFVADVRQRGGHAVLISPVARRRFDANGKIVNTHKGYDAAVHKTAQDLGVPFIDLTAQTASFYEYLGSENSKLAFGNNGSDGTHHNYYGAYAIAAMIAQALGNNFPNIEIEPKIRDANNYPLYEPTKLDDNLWPIILATPPQQTNEVRPIPAIVPKR